MDLSGTVGATALPANPLTNPPTGKDYYLGYDVTDGKVSTVYTCFLRNETEYCLKGYDTEAYETNVEIIKDAFANGFDGDCTFENDASRCFLVLQEVLAKSNGFVSANAISYGCDVNADGSFACFG